MKRGSLLSGRFSVHRLARYCLDLAELCKTERVVPVVIFLHEGNYPRELVLGGDRHAYLRFHYLVCDLPRIPFEQYRESNNIVARLNLPNMRYAPEQRVEVYAEAVRGTHHSGGGWRETEQIHRLYRHLRWA